MPVFLCHAVDSSGKTVRKKVEADTEAKAKALLQAQSLTVFQIDTVKSRADTQSLTLSASQKSLFVRQLATLLGAGYTLENALQSCGRQSQDAKIKSLSQTIHQRLVEGIPFHQILKKYPKIFDETFCATIEAGEKSGFLATILERLADFTESTQQLRSSIRQSLVYPIILLVVSLLMVGYLMFAVIPDVVKVFTAGGQSLPLLTDILLSVSRFFSRFGWVVVIIGIIAVIGLKRLMKKSIYRQRWHTLLIELPFFSTLIKDYQTANYASTLAVLLKSGVKLVDALGISAQTLSNMAMKSVAVSASDEVLKGKSLAQSLMSEKHVFSGMLIELIDSGERTGKLPVMLSKAGEIFLQQSQARIKTMTAMLGPLMILLMGAIIFMIVLAILLPIFDLNQTIK